jgi:3-hydroxyacyl-[acyl-carrier-protein] dehydratase
MRRLPENLRLGAGAIELIMPQRRPMCMVDHVRAFSPSPVPTLESGRHVTANESFFEGHFERLPIWPGVLTIEGMGQSATLLMVITLFCREMEGLGVSLEEALEAVRNIDRGMRMHPGYRADPEGPLERFLNRYQTRIAVGASVEVKFLRPVFPGCRLDYRVEWTEDLGDLVRFKVEAAVDEEPVAKGHMTGAQIELPPLPGAR